MKNASLPLLLAAALFVGASGSCMAAGKDRPDIGKLEYESKCAVCHGHKGKGDGGVLDMLKKAPSDLTVLTKKNGGVFPFERVYAVIDGREFVLGHGSRDMPIWGNAYKSEGMTAAEYFFETHYDMEMFARARILALIDYLNRLQVK